MKNASEPSERLKAKAKEAVFRYLKFRPRSEKEIRDKLRRKNFSPNIIEDTVTHFKRLRLIDDREFARSWIHSRLSRPFGLNRIRFELKTKGVQNDLIQKQFDSTRESYAETDIVMELARRRLARYKNLERGKARRRVFEFLARRGFNMDVISEVVKKL